LTEQKNYNNINFISMKNMFFLLFTVINLTAFAQVELNSTGSANAYTLAFPGVFSYSNGISFTFKANFANTDSATINVNSLGAKAIKKHKGDNLVANDIKSGQVVTLVYDGTNFQMTSGLGNAPGGGGGGAQTLSISNDTLSLSGGNSVKLPTVVGPVWKVTGNAGTDSAVNFIGTTDAQPLVFKTNATERMKLRVDGGLELSYGYGQSIAIGKAIPVDQSPEQTILIGDSAMFLMGLYESSRYHTVVGNSALYNFNGSFQDGATAIGYRAGYSLQSGVNTLVGSYAMDSATSASDNVAIGTHTLQSNVDGSYNTAIGSYANVGSGSLTNATAIGARALVQSSNSIVLGSINGVNNATADTKVGIGTSTPSAILDVVGSIRLRPNVAGAGYVLTTDGAGNATWQAGGGPGADSQTLSISGDSLSISNGNTILLPGRIVSDSAWSLLGNANIDSNVNFIGTTNLVPIFFRVNNQVRMKLTFNGFLEMSGSTNTGVGNAVMRNINFGARNTAFGSNALQSIVSGSDNTAMGVDALKSINNSSFNVAIGNYTLKSYTASRNIAVGDSALYTNINANDNVAIGHNALRLCTNTQNSAIGSNAGRFIAFATNNTCAGYMSLQTLTTGGSNTAVGAFADVSSSALSNTTAIGYGAIVNATNKVRLGDVNVTVIEGKVPFTSPSDGRFKTNVSEADVKGLDFITRLRPVNYNFDTRKFQEFLTKDMAEDIRQKHMESDFKESTAMRQTGFIAQEVEIAAKQAHYDFSSGLHIPESEGDNYSIAYSQFVVPLVKSIQELNEKLNELIKENESLKTRQGMALNNAKADDSSNAALLQLQKEIDLLKSENSNYVNRINQLQSEIDFIEKQMTKINQEKAELIKGK